MIPNIEGEFVKERAVDELPQSAAGRTIMTTEPKFIPEDAVSIELEQNARPNVRMIDCVGYIVPSSLGYIENEQPRMVMTPWFDEEIPFNMAAEIGTQKVIQEHSTIGLVVTTDGSISEIPRRSTIVQRSGSSGNCRSCKSRSRCCSTASNRTVLLRGSWSNRCSRSTACRCWRSTAWI